MARDRTGCIKVGQVVAGARHDRLELCEPRSASYRDAVRRPSRPWDPLQDAPLALRLAVRSLYLRLGG